VPLSSDEPLSPPTPLPPLIPRSAIVDSRIKSRTIGVDIDTNKLSTTIKRSQAISNIQDLDEDSPVTFEIEHHGRKRDHIQTISTSTNTRTINELISSIEKQLTNNSTGGGDDGSDTRSESSEKTPEYLEEDKPILPGIHVKGATLNRLIRFLIDSFGKFK
jgi:hypothetical protein